MIPDELTTRAQWIVWRSEQRRGKVTKVPYVPGTHRRARSNDPSTWRTFEQAVASRRRDSFDGVGYAFSADDGLTGIDLDHCAGDYGVLEPWALRIVQELDSYAEWSPSGHGVHIFVQAQLPPRGRKRGDVEMYDRLRFFATTGHWLPITPVTIESRQAELDRLHARVFPPPAPKRVHSRAYAPTPDDVTLIQRAQSAWNGCKFSALWAGDTSTYARGGNAGRSEGDLALCRMLVYWTGGDADRVDRLFRQSGLYRPKWDHRHYADGRTYGQATIERAIR
jgi:primase-polymerase (primpol)-like protein